MGRRSLTTIITLSLLACSILPILGMVFAVVATITNRLEQEALTHMHSLTESIATVTNDYLLIPLQMLESLETLLESGESFDYQRILEAYAKNRDDIDALILTDRSGIALWAAPDGAGQRGKDFSGEPGFQDALAGSAVVYSRPYLALGTGRITVSVVLAMRDRVGIVQLNLAYLSESIQPLLSGAEDQIGLIDSWGRFIAHTDPVHVYEQRYSPMREMNPDHLFRHTEDGKTWLIASHRIAGTSWGVQYFRPLSEVYAVLRVVMLSAVNIGILAVAGALITAMWLRQAIINPFSSIIAKTAHIAAGNYQERITGIYPAEIARFAEAFNSMTASVEKRSQELQTSEERYRAFFIHLAAPVLILGPEGDAILDANPSALHFYGYSHAPLTGLTLSDLEIRQSDIGAPGSCGTSKAEDSSTNSGKYHAMHRLQNGALRELEINLAPVQLDGRELVMAILFDITEQKRSERVISQALAEKTVLLREVHHRVKNNLQIITSLLELQVPALREAEDAALFRISQQRIKSMALVHELLYKSSDLASIDIREYLNRLVEELSHTGIDRLLRVSQEVDMLQISIEQALPLGLILNELLTNALKYAALPGLETEVHIGLLHQGGSLRLSVTDNGPGLPEQMEPSESSSLGFSLICALASQLKGIPVWTKAAPDQIRPGVAFSLVFPLQTPGKPAVATEQCD